MCGGYLLLTPKEADTNATLGLVEAITEPAPEVLFAPIGAENIQDLRQIAEIFKQKTDPTNLSFNRHQFQGWT